jgi:hypothetical protein
VSQTGAPYRQSPRRFRILDFDRFTSEEVVADQLVEVFSMPAAQEASVGSHILMDDPERGWPWLRVVAKRTATSWISEPEDACR